MNNPANAQEGKSEKENKAFEALLKNLGAYELERRIKRLASYRLYDRKYPYDVVGQKVNIDDVEIPVEDNMLERLIADEAVRAFKGDLTDKQLEVLELTEQGFKPREIASMQGSDNGSGSTRWHKFVVKQKALNRPGKEKL